MSNMTNNKAKIPLPIIGRRELLARSPYFIGLSDQDVLRVEELMREERYDRDDFIYTEGDDDHYLYLIASGAVKVFGTSADGKEQILSLGRPGDSFNDVAAFDGRLTPSGAQALTPLVIYRISGPELLARSCSYGALAANIIRALGQRIRELGELVADLSFRPVAGRLAKLILEQLPHTGSVRLTQRDMASMAGTAREVVARALKSMEEDGNIKIERQRIIILNRSALEKMAA